MTFPQNLAIKRSLLCERALPAHSNKRCLDKDTANSEYASHEISTFHKITLSDTEKACEEAQTISKLRSELWISETRFNKKISSMQKTAKNFGLTDK